MSQQAVFKAKFLKMSLSNKTQVTLEIPEETRFEILAQIAKMRGMFVIVQLGDPQMSIEDFEDDYREEQRRGVTYTTDASGVVESVQNPDESEQEPTEGEQEEMDFEQQEEDFNLEEDETEDDGEDVTVADAAGDGVTDDSEAVQTAIDESAIDKEEIEQFILESKPSFEDIQYDFPALLERKKAGETWMDIASSLGVSKSQLATKFSTYKKRVAEMMKGQGAA